MPLLGTKLHLPSLRRRLVQRARLTDQLRADGGEGPRLVLVAAPAGFGKTALLAQWLAVAEEPRRRVAWLGLDPDDADLGLFLTRLVAAVQTAEPEVGVDALALLTAGGTAATDAVLVSLINDLDVLAGPTVVAFDIRPGLLRKSSVRPRLSRRGGLGPAAGRGTRVPARHLGARPADRRSLRRPDRSLRWLDTVGYALLEEDWSPT